MKISMPNGSIVNKIISGSKINWLLIPGGPGMSSDYLAEIFEKIDLQGTIHTFDFFKYPSLADEFVLENIEADINYFCDRFENVVLLGHSSAGMLLQSIRLKRNCKVILLCSSPSLTCFEIAQKESEHFTAEEKSIIEIAEKNYSMNKSNDSFKKLFKAWRPYYALKKHESVYDSLIDNCGFDWKFYEWGNRFFFNYFSQHNQKIKNVLMVNSDFDKLCPTVLCEDLYSKETIVSLPLHSHFPWIENTELFKKTFKEIESAILSEL